MDAYILFFFALAAFSGIALLNKKIESTKKPATRASGNAAGGLGDEARDTRPQDTKQREGPTFLKEVLVHNETSYSFDDTIVRIHGVGVLMSASEEELMEIRSRLRDFAASGPLRITPIGAVADGALVARIMSGDTDIGLHMVRNGLLCSHRSNDYLAAEMGARRHGRGLWRALRDDGPISHQACAPAPIAKIARPSLAIQRIQNNAEVNLSAGGRTSVHTSPQVPAGMAGRWMKDR